VEFVVDKVALGQVFTEYFGFPLAIQKMRTHLIFKAIYLKDSSPIPPASLEMIFLTSTRIQHSTFFFLILVCETIGTAATTGLLCQPRVIVKMIVEKQMECRLAGETEVLLGENLPQRHFCPSQNHALPDPILNPGRRGGKLTTNSLSYGAALVQPLTFNLQLC
jgi:hypothetical protein